MEKEHKPNETPEYLAALGDFLLACGRAANVSVYPDLEDLAIIGSNCCLSAPNHVVVAVQKTLRRESKECADKNAAPAPKVIDHHKKP